jgi:hypothetical protein
MNTPAVQDRPSSVPTAWMPSPDLLAEASIAPKTTSTPASSDHRAKICSATRGSGPAYLPGATP